MASRVDSKVPTPNMQPPKRQMVHLKTKEECRLGNETIQVWTVEMPSRYAEGVLKVIKNNVDGQDSIDLQHLRRFAKPKYLPPHVLGQRDKVKELYAIPRAWESTPYAVMQAPSTTVWEYTQPMKTRISMRPPTLHLLICPTKVVSLNDLHKLLMEYPPFCSSPDSWAYPLQIKEVTVPLLAPTSPAQADMWSTNYWPTFYRKTNPFGAHPTTIAKAEDDLQFPEEGNMGVDDAMALAKKASRATQARGYGAGPGCVILERVENKTEIIAVAGDARQKPIGGEMMTDFPTGPCTGNIMGHAVMRAVGMIGRKRLRVASQPISTRAAKAERGFELAGLAHDEEARDAFFLDLPITPLEEQYFVKDNVKPDGYLCLRLEVFLTHEPCVMCSMALVHSRVGRVIFTNRMPLTGGLTSEMVSNISGPPGLGYGLCWRKELNWQFMCWEYLESKDGAAGQVVVKEAGRTAGKSTGNVLRADSPVHDEDDDEDDEDMFINDNANSNSFASSTHV